MTRRRVLLGLGSNLSGRWSHLAGALQQLVALNPSLAISSVYETAPVGGPTQGPYLNAVVSLNTDADPSALLSLIRRLEQAAGRLRLERWGPRTLDVDVLVVEGLTSTDPELELPHPRAFERAFVLAPMEEVAPDLVPEDWRQRLGGAAAVSAAVRRVGVIIPARAAP
jgi:2-amino-4-hydroxy-6-hydroxymethyldihydropteridine diphosphokinase